MLLIFDTQSYNSLDYLVYPPHPIYRIVVL